MSIEISPFKPKAAPRKANEYDKTIVALSKARDTEPFKSDKSLRPSVVLTATPENIARELRRFREAANFADHRAREVERETLEDGQIAVRLTISKSQTIAESAPATDAAE